jgi:hypothetical protein
MEKRTLKTRMVCKGNQLEGVAAGTGREKVLGFLVGQVIKQTQASASPQQVNALLKAKLNLERAVDRLLDTPRDALRGPSNCRF